MQSLRHTVLKWGIIGTVFGTQVLCFGNRVFPHITSKTFFFYGAVQLLFALWLYMVSTDRSYRLTKRQWLYLLPFIGYVAWMSIAGVFAVDPGLALWGSLMRGTGLLTLYYGLALALMTASLIHKYGKVFALDILKWSVAAGAIVGASIWLGDEGFNVGITVLQKGGGGGLVGNSSLAAAYLLFVLVFGAVLLAAKEVSRNTKRWLGVALAVILFSPVFINLLGLFNGRGIWGSARGATLGIAVSAGVALCWYMVSSQKRSIKIVGVLSSVVGVLAFIVIGNQLMTPGTSIHQRFVSATSETRFTFWSIATRAMHERPFVGYGPENFPRAVQTYFEPQLLSRDQGFEIWTDKAHNIYYDTGVSGGYPAIALYIAFLISVIAGMRTIYRKGILSRTQVSMFVGLVIGYVFQNLFVFDSVASLFVLFILIAISIGLIDTSESATHDPLVLDEGRKYMLGTVLLLCAIFGWYQYGYTPARKSVAFGRVLSATLDKRPDLYRELLQGSPVGNYWDVGGFTHDEYKLYAKNPDAIKTDAKLLPYAKKDVLAYIDYIEIVAAKDPTDYRLQLSIIHLYNTYIYLADLPYDPILAGRIDAHIAQAKTLAPRDPQLYWAIAQMAAWQNDLPAVIQGYKDAIAVDPTLASSQRLLLQFLEALGTKKQYAEALANAQKEIPGFTMQ